MKASPRILVLACVALGVFAAACGGVTLQPSDGGSTGGHGGGGGSSGGQSGSAGSGGTGGSGGAQCDSLDETTCKTRADCTAQYCHACPNQSQFEGCTTVGAPPMECAEECVEAACGDLAEAACSNRADCQTYYCSDCKGGQTFIDCGTPGGGPGIECQVCPASCAGLDETACTNGCIPEYCPNCDGGRTFEGCSPPNSGAIACPATACPAPAPCSTVTTEAACNARTDCHSVFDDPGTCGCNAVGCCAHFSWCADGAKASCGGVPLCQVVGPYCDGTAYVVSYTASCFEGCVRPSECGP